MKVNKKCVQSMYTVLGAFVLLIFWANCTKTTPEQTELLLEDYPKLYEAVFERDSDKILSFTSANFNEEVQKKAWNTLISTPVEDVSSLIEVVVKANTDEAWASLWFKEIEEEDIEKLHLLWEEEPELRKGLASVLGQRGNQETLNILLETELKNDTHLIAETALAIGRLSIESELSGVQEIQILNKAFSTMRSEITQGYLYGFYRSRKDLSEIAQKEFVFLLENYYPDDQSTEQYIARMLLGIDLDEALFRYELDEFETMDVQLAIEVAQGLRRYELTKHAKVVLNALLDHINPNVRIETLRTISAKQDELDGELDNAILNKIGLIRGLQPSLRLEALNAIKTPEKYKDLVYDLGESTPYARPIMYNALAKVITDEELFEQFKSDASSENRLIRFFALQQLSNWWSEFEDIDKADTLTMKVKEMLIQNMETADRSMIYVIGSLFRDEQLISDSDYKLFEDLLSRFKLPEDIEVYQVITSILKERFESEAESLIDSLATQNNVALNESLRNQGWEIPDGESPTTEFRTPNWKKLTRLGAYPVLILETSKGEIKIQMDVLNAPATISGIQSLIKAKAYNGVPFHRVVPNFVIQGGDIETQDGFGGPDFVVPTEASPTQYERGKVGIASAGTDTEGSQFFVMNQWQPHLTGRYTIIGTVIEGMVVVDRMVQGDVIREVNWEWTW